MSTAPALVQSGAATVFGSALSLTGCTVGNTVVTFISGYSGVGPWTWSAIVPGMTLLSSGPFPKFFSSWVASGAIFVAPVTSSTMTFSITNPSIVGYYQMFEFSTPPGTMFADPSITASCGQGGILGGGALGATLYTLGTGVTTQLYELALTQLTYFESSGSSSVGLSITSPWKTLGVRQIDSSYTAYLFAYRSLPGYANAAAGYGASSNPSDVPGTSVCTGSLYWQQPGPVGIFPTGPTSAVFPQLS